MKVLLLLFFFCVSVQCFFQTWTYWKLDTYFTCSVRPEVFSFHIKILKHSNQSDDVLLCAGGSSKDNWTMLACDYTDFADSRTVSNYEIYVEIYHNCVSGGLREKDPRTNMFKHKLGDYPREAIQYNVTLAMDLSNKGEVKDEDYFSRRFPCSYLDWDKENIEWLKKHERDLKLWRKEYFINETAMEEKLTLY